MPCKRGEMLRFAVAFALRRLKIHGRKGAMTEAQRYDAGDLVVRELKRYGDPWKLDENVPERSSGPRWENGKPPPGYQADESARRVSDAPSAAAAPGTRRVTPLADRPNRG